MYITPRTLLGIIRLAQAMAKLNFRDEVTQGDIDEGINLMDFSIRSLRTLKDDKKSQGGVSKNIDKMFYYL
jgi:DNA replication licensing factor MCM7